MSFFDWLNGKEETKKETKKEAEAHPGERVADTEFAEENNAHLDLRQEELDIDKHREGTGEVVLHKNIIEEEQSVNVPVAHDQVVIERRAVDHEPTDDLITQEEDVHIPVTAEKIDVDKHTVVTGEVEAHKRSVQETEQVSDVLHKEVADVEAHGDTDVINEE